MRALDDEIAFAATELTNNGLIAATDNPATAVEVLQQPVFELGFDRRLPAVPPAASDQLIDDLISADGDENGNQIGRAHV